MALTIREKLAQLTPAQRRVLHDIGCGLGRTSANTRVMDALARMGLIEAYVSRSNTRFGGNVRRWRLVPAVEILLLKHTYGLPQLFSESKNA